MRRSPIRTRSRRPRSQHCSETWLERIKNGELLALAEQEFDGFVTVDRKLASQQDLTKLQILVLLIRARTNRLEHIRPLAAEVLEKLPRASAGALSVIGT
jgi:hypothetical protein